jgi:hypothetical protein
VVVVCAWQEELRSGGRLSHVIATSKLPVMVAVKDESEQGRG